MSIVTLALYLIFKIVKLLHYYEYIYDTKVIHYNICVGSSLSIYNNNFVFIILKASVRHSA